MTTRDALAVALHAQADNCDCGTPSLYYLELADAVIAAVRALPVEDQADLIGGAVEVEPANLAPDGWPAHHRVVSSYTEVPR
jgi:hypothetical protein